MPDTTDEAEIRDGAGWRRIRITEALGMPRDVVLRCPECHGPMRVHRKGTTGQRAHFEHRQAHKGCSLKPRTFSGKLSRHPHALE